MHQMTIFDEDDEMNLGAPVEAPEDVQNAWRKAKQTMKRNFTQLQEMDEESVMDKSDVLKIALAIQGIALGCPKNVLRRIEEYLKDIEEVVGKYAGTNKLKEDIGGGKDNAGLDCRKDQEDHRSALPGE